MKKYTGWLVLGVAATVGVVGLAVGSAAAQQGGAAAQEDGEGGPGHGRLARIREALGLTDDQVQELRDTFLAFRDQTRELREQIKTEVKGIPDLVRRDDLTQADLMAVHDRVHDIAGQLGEKRVEMLYQMWQKLTPEQRGKLGDLIAERADGASFDFFGGGGHHGRGGPGGPDDEGRAGRPDRAARADRPGRVAR
ncbi:MAG: Spy/CpxP family protein refolding chaperone [Deltaproteobacteria bacterium]|nr:Spy/CpxP family protein refolding chaperone [Deltaproteobacteria bacterium]